MRFASGIGIFFARLLALLASVTFVLLVYLLWARPYQLTWGATEAEIMRPMPGDQLDPTPLFLATRAITIDGTPQEIWPWLLQMGYGRAGFYGYDILENLGSSQGMRSADQIIPAFQHFKAGDKVPLSAAGGVVFYAIVPNQYLIWTGENGKGAFTWALYPIDATHTRLVSRIRWTHHWTEPGALGFDLFTEFTDHLAVRKVLQGVKGRVEGHIEPMMQGNLEFALYLGALSIYICALLLTVLRPLSWERWLVGVATGLAWLVTWYAPIPFGFSAALELIIFWLLANAYGPLSWERPVNKTFSGSMAK
jgi:hypothetical protein